MSGNALGTRWCYALWVFLLAGTLATFSPNVSKAEPAIFVRNGGSLTAYRLSDRSVLWSASTGLSSVNNVVTVPDGNRAVVLVHSYYNQTMAYDSGTGSLLWSTPSDIWASTRGVATDVHGQLYTCPISYPLGAPRIGGGAPGVLVSTIGATSTTSFVDSRTGLAYWDRTDPSRQYGSGFIPNDTGSYDAIISSSVFYTGTGGDMYRVDGATGATVIWSRHFSNRQGIAVPDVTGDGKYDLFGAPSAWSSQLQMFNGATGETFWSGNYGSFDVIGGHVIAGASGYDVIASAQGSSAGGVRRYRAADGTVVWDSSATYNNQTMLGLLKRADGGMTILSGWRHQGRAVGIDAASGQTLWNNVLLSDADCGAIGVPDLTGDGSEDVLSVSGGLMRLYDGVTGAEQTWFSPIVAQKAAYVPEPTSLALLVVAGFGVLTRRRRG